MSIAWQIKTDLGRALAEAYPEIKNSSDQNCIRSRGTSYIWPGAFLVGRMVQLDVTTVAAEIKKHFSSEECVIEDISDKDISDKGIIQFAVKTDAIAKRLDSMHKDARLGVSPSPKKRVVIDYSSPNVAKELHVGHLRSTIIGEALARILEFKGHDVLRLNHIGDWGTQFGMLICYLKKNEIDVPSLDLPKLMEFYRAAKKCFDTDASFKNGSRAEVVRLQGGDTQSRAVWQQICQVSRDAFQQIYKILDITVTERGESFYNDMLEPITQELLKKGVAKVEDGAVCAFVEGVKVPFFLKKSDGGYTYDTTDMAALKHRIEVEKAERIIYVVDSGQSEHFHLLKQIAIKAKILDPSKTELIHVPFGLVLGPDKKKYKTRSGEVALLKDLLHESIEKSTRVFEEKAIEKKTIEKKTIEKKTIENIEESARILGIAALKYADLKNSRQKNYVFNSEKMLSFEGDTAAFIQYTIVRIRSISEKFFKTTSTIPDVPFVLSHESEKDLGFHILQFGEVLAIVEESLEPHHLSRFLHELAVKFNAFYKNCRVIKDEKEASRMRLCDLTEKVGEKGLTLLGIKTLDRM